MRRLLIGFLGLAVLTSAGRAAAADPPLADQQHLFELGIFGGVFIPPDEHELFDENNPHQALEDVALDVGIRAGYLPMPWLGAEMEFAAMPTSTAADSSATVLGFRGHLLAQYPARLAPFLVVGGGLLHLTSDDDVLGSDTDGVFHWGVGLKYYPTRWLALRLDGRHILGSKLGEGGTGHYFEALGGLSFVLSWEKGTGDKDGDGVPDDQDSCPEEPADTADGCPVRDRDGDGLPDDKDSCPDEAASTADGCPVRDRDGDGVPDDKDRCPDKAAATADGCPLDRDGDGVPDETDRCPDTAAKTEDGCPLDSDGDGIIDELDKCPNEPETKNGYQDDDGCPDEVPKEVKRFTGAIKGITFDLGKATIRKTSYPTLDRAVKVLKDYGQLKLVIRGHTDSTGSQELNQKLSYERAQAVKDYMVSKGIAAERLRVEGLGPDEPIADNKTARGRAENRRIEFKLDQGS